MAKLAWALTIGISVLLTNQAQAESDLHKIANLETQTSLAQRQLGLLQAQAAIEQFKGTGGQPLPQIISLYGSVSEMRALVDLAAAGVRDVGKGDSLTSNLTVVNIDMKSGVEVALKGSKATFHLAMKSAPAPQTSSIGVSAPSSVSNGYPIGPGLVVPPIQPMMMR